MNAMVIKSLMRQQQELTHKHPDGVYIILNSEDPLDIQADLAGPVETPYEKGVFRIKLIIPQDFPNTPPKGYFATKIYHPNVSPKGEICVNTLKKDWNPKLWSLYNVFEVIKCLLIYPFAESSLNEEAGKQFMDNYSDYFKTAKNYTNIYATNTIKSTATNDGNTINGMQKNLNHSSQQNIEFEKHFKENNDKSTSSSMQLSFQNKFLLRHHTDNLLQSNHKSLHTLSSSNSNNNNTINVLNNKTNLLDQQENSEASSKRNLNQFNQLRTSGSFLVKILPESSLTDANMSQLKNDDIKKWMARI